MTHASAAADPAVPRSSTARNGGAHIDSRDDDVRPANEVERLEYLHSLSVLDTPDEERFARLTRIAALAFEVPIAAVSLLDDRRQWFKSSVGLAGRELARRDAICRHTICGDDVLVVEDAHHDARFAHSPLVTGAPRVRFYAGCPLDTGTGHAVGTFAVMDTRPRDFEESQIALLRELAAMASGDLTTMGAEAAQQALLDSEDLHRSVIDVLDEGVVVIADTGLMLSANASAARILESRLEPGVPPPLPGNVVGADGQPLPPEARPIPVTLATGEAQTDVLMGGSRDGRPIRWIRVNTQPLFRPGEDHPWAAVASIADVTEVRAVQRAKDEFVSVVSHELRTPLTSIRGALSLLASGKLGAFDQKPRQMLDIAVKNTDRLVRLINDILDIERLDSNSAQLERTSCDLAELIEHSVELLQPLADEYGVVVSTSTDTIGLNADADRLVQTFTNLLSNALKFSDAGGTVEITARRTDDGALVQVHDHGRGIPADKLDTIFGRFQQVDASDSRDRGGTGLGLAICEAIVQQHGGRVWVDSVLGEGSTFSLTLPIGDSGTSDADADSDQVVDDDGPRVLICDDDESIRTTLKAVLEEHGYQVSMAANGDEAVESALRSPPYAILLDLAMPVRSGWETMAELRQHDETREIPVVILSALPHADSRRRMAEEAFGWVDKPVDENHLMSTLARAVASRPQLRRVLLIEDDLDLAGVLRTMLEQFDIEVIHAASVEEAISLGQDVDPDLIVLDVVLPDGDGFAVIEWMRHHSRLRTVPVIVHSADEVSVRDRARLSLGRTRFVTKSTGSADELERLVGAANEPDRLDRGERP